MDPLTITAAAGMRARLESLDLLSNNLANASTPGYKGDRESYATYLSAESALSQSDEIGRAQALSPLVESAWTDLRAGSLRQTGNPRDFAIDGAGFLIADSPRGPVLARSGALQVSTEGKLVTPEGYEVHTTDTPRIKAQRDLPLSIHPDGSVAQEGTVLGRLRIVQPERPALQGKREGAYFLLDSQSLPSLPQASGEIRQGYQEDSNVNPAEAATRLIDILREFESLQRAIQIGGEMNRRSIEEVARVAS